MADKKAALPLFTDSSETPEPKVTAGKCDSSFLTDKKIEAVGILEVYGLVCAFMAADSGCKAADVWLEDFDRNKPANAETLSVPLLVTIKFRGSVANVQAALDAAETTAKAHSGVVVRHIIANPTTDTAKMLKLSGFDSI